MITKEKKGNFVSSLTQLKKWFQAHSDEIKKDYFAFLRFKSISTESEYQNEMIACAEWLISYISKHTLLKAELIKTAGQPLIYAEHKGADRGAPTLLVYGHYDVQPVDPIELWKSDPFEPEERDGKIYARGAVDDKGQIFYALAAMRALHELNLPIPVRLKFVIEGEEESGSHGLAQVLPHSKDKFKADALLVVDFDQFDETTPAITLSARGIIAFDVTLRGSHSDLHSGLHGGTAYNPNRALAELLAKVWDEEGRVQIEGFYDDVLVPTEVEKKLYASRYDEKSYRKEFGIDAIGGEKGFSLAEKTGLRPTLEINGMSGGYTGKGFKTVIPAEAKAKISCRLVANQDPEKIVKSVTDFLKKNVKSGIHIEVKLLGADKAFRGKYDSPLAKALIHASTEVMGEPCQRVLGGGSIPIVANMCDLLGVEVVGMGQGLATDQIHAPNEHFDFKRFEYGFLSFARTLELL
jgi:acetylornithine deacetylase/succinyl-diaminopimelate desuccinylase-like protein